MKTSVGNLKVESKSDDQRINLIERLIKLGFSPEEAKETSKANDKSLIFKTH